MMRLRRRSMPAMWLLKTEPSTYSYDDLEREGRTVWDGVANAAALKHMRAMKVDEGAIIYHTGAEKAAVGIARVVRAAYADPEQDDPRRIVVDVAAVRRLKQPVPLTLLKASRLFAASPLVRQGRLSVVPLDRAQWEAIEKGAGL